MREIILKLWFRRVNCHPILRHFSAAQAGAPYVVSTVLPYNVATRLYTAEHEWVQEIQPGVGAIGITDYAQKTLGDLVYVELPKVGVTVQQRGLIGVVESVKAASDIYAPVSGKVIELNERVIRQPSLINKQPFGDGWLCKIALSKPEESKALMDGVAYDRHCNGS